jgi:hypothetical protein
MASTLFNLGQTCYFNNAVNTFLGEIGNWWQDSAYTIPAGFVPDNANNVVFGNGITIEGISGSYPESATYNSIIADGAIFNGSNYNPFTVIATNGITATNSDFFVCVINASGTYTGCVLANADYGSAIIGGNVTLYNCAGIVLHDSDNPQIAKFTGNVDAYYPTSIVSGSVQGTLTRHGYSLSNTCLSHCNLNETNGTRTVLDLYAQKGISVIVTTGAGFEDANNTFYRPNAFENTFVSTTTGIIFDGNKYKLIINNVDYYYTTDLVNWFSTNSIYNPPPTTVSTTGFTVGYGMGLIGNAAKFNNNCLVNPNPDGGNPLQLTAQFSISVWVNFPFVPSGSNMAIVGTGYELYPNSLTIYGGSGQFGLFVDATSGGTITGPYITANTWYNCVVTCTTNTIKFYVNGSFQGQLSTPLINTAGPCLSAYLQGYQLINNTLVDEFNIFTIDLNQDEINTLYNNGAGFSFPFINRNVDWARMLHLPFFFDSKKTSLARLLYLPWFINI